MAQWIAILVVLVCLSGSSLSRSWIGFDDSDDFESWQANPHDYGSNQKSKYNNGEDSCGSDEDFDDSGYENGYEHDKPISSNNGYHKDHGSHSFHDHHQIGHHHDHGYIDNGGYPGHHTQGGSPGQPDQYWGSIGHHSHSTSSDQPGQNWGSQGHHGQTGYTGQPGENGVSQGDHQSQTGSPDQHTQNVGSHGHNTQSANPDQPGNAQSMGSSRGLPPNNINRLQVPRNDADRIVFPDINNQIPTTRSPSTTRPLTTTARATTQTIPQTTPQTTTMDRTLLDLVVCIRACPVTSEYNPVCGTNNVTYNNPGALQCARNCGLNVAVARQAPCPRTNPQPPITSRPITNPTDRPTPRPLQGTTMRTTSSIVNPTRYTNINVNFVNRPGTTIPIEILQNVFGNASPTTSNTEEPEFDIDKRRKP